MCAFSDHVPVLPAWLERIQCKNPQKITVSFFCSAFFCHWAFSHYWCLISQASLLLLLIHWFRDLNKTPFTACKNHFKVIKTYIIKHGRKRSHTLVLKEPYLETRDTNRASLTWGKPKLSFPVKHVWLKITFWCCVLTETKQPVSCQSHIIRRWELFTTFLWQWQQEEAYIWREHIYHGLGWRHWLPTRRSDTARRSSENVWHRGRSLWTDPPHWNGYKSSVFRK